MGKPIDQVHIGSWSLGEKSILIHSVLLSKHTLKSEKDEVGLKRELWGVISNRGRSIVFLGC